MVTFTDKGGYNVFIKLPTTKKEYVINLDKVLFFYDYKDNVTRFELDDGSLVDVNVKYEDIAHLLNHECVNLLLVI